MGVIQDPLLPRLHLRRLLMHYLICTTNEKNRGKEKKIGEKFPPSDKKSEEKNFYLVPWINKHTSICRENSNENTDYCQ